MASEQELQAKCKSLEDRLTNMRVTIKQLGDDNTAKDVEIRKLREELEAINNKALGLSLQLDKANEDMTMLRKSKSVRVYDATVMERAITKLSERIQALETGIKNQEIAYSKSDIGKVTKQLENQVALNVGLQQQLNDLNETINEQYIASEKRENIIRNQQIELESQAEQLRQATNNAETIKLCEYNLQEKEDEIKQLTSEIEDITLKYEIKHKKQIIVNLISIAIALMCIVILLW